MTRVENILQERRKPRTIKSLSGCTVNLDKIERETRERIKQQKKEDYIKRLRIRALLLEYFNPEMLPEISPPEDIESFEVLIESTGEILRQVLDKPLE